MSNDFDFLSDSTEQTSTRYVTMVTPKLNRFDLAILTTNRFYGKKLIIDMQSGISVIIGPDDLDEEGLLERRFRLNEEQAEELHEFLSQIVGPISYPDD
ncbi:DUF3055 domain-containing protein [Paenibacillus antri]|uniref:DUF3055 domain-containing protein n=1 Tax=Paenibacillus antri TaxID=2582848 RepID=A0A5R9GB07_9BACL|nr:DUF3055 domain-containing protein [Paenibacillus antri]TLS51506.1 DUF3055 domain-containing protein [Paenibacillus antri]